MDIHDLQQIATFTLINRERHLRRQFVEHAIGIQGILFTDRYCASKKDSVADSFSSRDRRDVAIGARDGGWTRTTRIGTIKFLTWLQVIGLRTITTIV